jgi:hypothetical protein
VGLRERRFRPACSDATVISTPRAATQARTTRAGLAHGSEARTGSQPCV